MEQRDSLDRSSSENVDPQSTLNESGYNDGSEVPISGQTTLAPQSTLLPVNESSPVVDSVLQSDVGPLGEFLLERPELKAADWHQYLAHTIEAKRCIS